MTSATTIAGEEDSVSRSSRVANLLNAHPLLLALFIVAVTTALRAPGTVDADVAWQLWIGRQLNHGAHLYRDIVETNPPLWFWMAGPVDRLSELVHLRSDHLLILLTGCAAGLALAATNRLLGAINPLGRALFLAYAALILVAMPWLEVGQREHLALLGTMPYAALIAARREGRPVPSGLAVAIGVGAALGFALKHYFLIVPILLEAWLLAGLGRKWRPIRVETAAVASVGIAYAAAMLIVARDYFANILPMLLLAYGATGAKRVVDLFQPAVIAALLSIALLLSNPRLLRSSGVGAALTVASVGFAAVYFLQAKGWSYHAVPMLGCAALAIAACLSSGANLKRLTLLAAPALLVLPFTISVQQAQREPEFARDVDHAIQGLRTGDAVGFVAADPSFGWHVIPQRGFRFALRSNGFWMMQAVVNNELRGSPDARLTKLGRRVVAETVLDFRCTPPRRIIFRRPSDASVRAGEFDILGFFLRDPQFAALLGHYRRVERSSVDVFELATPFERALNCPSWSPA